MRKACPHCDYDVPSRRGALLKRHVKRNHPEKLKSFLKYYDKTYTKPPKDYSFKCKHCGKHNTNPKKD